MGRIPLLVVAAALGILGTAPSTSHSAYQNGDLYLLSQSLPKPGGGALRGIVRIAPSTGTSTLLYSTGIGLGNHLTYDAYRDLLVFARADSLLGVNSSGTVSTLAKLGVVPGALAARGDGIIYLQLGSELRYLDNANALHPVLDQAGLATFTIGGPGSIRVLHYHAPTQSLIAFFLTNSLAAFCPTSTAACLTKIPLNGAGTQVASAVVGAQVEVSTSGEAPTGAGTLPGDQVLFVIDTNSNAQETRMLALDPATMAISGYAANGPYTGAAAVDAGTYSSVRGEAVILDSFSDVLRGFSSGSSGNGTSFSGGGTGFGVSSAGGSGEAARLVEIILVPTPVRGAALPANLILASPFPNPFNPSSTLRFHVAKEGAVRLDVYDVNGRRVRTLVDGTRHVGWHEAAWDGTDEGGSRVASGVYFARLASAGETRTQRFVVLR